MIDVAVLRALAAQGATVEMIIAAVEAAQKPELERQANRRELSRKRQQKQRSRHANIALQCVTSRDTPSPAPSLDKENPPDPLKKLNPSPPLPLDPNGSCQMAKPSDPMPIMKAFENWNKIAEANGLPKATRLTDARRTKLRARLKEHGLDGWNEALWKIEGSEFLLGKNGRDWSADLDFLLSPTKFIKVLEGGYATKDCEQ